ncbi:MAG: hypothetical protein FRX49_06334 [Trebouxia sp. A1-2]|nr:MAG: hypothetical protein FRX49_06334 [Trebouxia sp. A1-2]
MTDVSPEAAEDGSVKAAGAGKEASLAGGTDNGAAAVGTSLPVAAAAAPAMTVAAMSSGMGTAHTTVDDKREQWLTQAH